MRKKIIITVVLLLAVGFIFFKLTHRGNVTIATQKVSRQNIEEKVYASGDLSSENRADLTFKVSGKIEKIYQNPGDKVVKGQIIASLDKTDFVSAVSQRENTYQAAQSNVQKVLDDIHLYQYGNGGFPGIGGGETETQKNLRQTAEATRDTAYDQLKDAKNSLKETDLLSPVNGTVTSVSKSEGENVTAYATAIATVADLSKPIFEIQLDENDIGKVKTGQEAKITIDAYSGKEITGKIYEIEPQITKTAEGSTVVNAKIKLDPFDSQVIIGLEGDSEIKTAQSDNVITVLQSAVFEKDNQKFVWVVENGKAKKVEVQTGIESQDQVEITSGLSENQTVITEQVDTIKEGQKITTSNGG